MIDTATMILELRQHLGVDSSDLDDPSGLLLLNRAYWDLLNRFPYKESEVTATFVTVAGTRFYQIPTDFEAIRQISLEDPNTFKHDVLERTTLIDYENRFVNDASAQTKPTDYCRESNGIRLLPTPDVAYTLTLKYWASLQDLVSGGAQPFPQMPRVWGEVILFGGVWRGFARFGDTDRMIKYIGLCDKRIAEIVPVQSKEEADTHLGGVDMAGYDPASVYFNQQVTH